MPLQGMGSDIENKAFARGFLACEECMAHLTKVRSEWQQDMSSEDTEDYIKLLNREGIVPVLQLTSHVTPDEFRRALIYKYDADQTDGLREKLRSIWYLDIQLQYSGFWRGFAYRYQCFTQMTEPAETTPEDTIRYFELKDPPDTENAWLLVTDGSDSFWCIYSPYRRKGRMVTPSDGS